GGGHCHRNLGAFQMSDRSFGHNPVDAQVGHNVMAKRTELGLSQGHVAEQLGLTLDEYQKCESGMRRFGAERLFKFARLMDVPPDYFFHLSDVGNMPRNALVN
ncbi:MAG: helix-turn-helix transcriptional regulator, partial [Roseiarcus sp.]